MADRHSAQRSCLAFLILVSLSGGASAKKDDGLSIADARGLGLGTTVTVQGTVTVPTNAFDPGFGIQEDKAGSRGCRRSRLTGVGRPGGRQTRGDTHG